LTRHWPKLFHNLRASRETELAAEHPIHVVCAWIGNSQQIAAKHYLQVTDADFEKARRASTHETTQSRHVSARQGSPRKAATPVFPGKEEGWPTCTNVQYPLGESNPQQKQRKVATFRARRCIIRCSRCRIALSALPGGVSKLYPPAFALASTPPARAAVRQPGPPRCRRPGVRNRVGVGGIQQAENGNHFHTRVPAAQRHLFHSPRQADPQPGPGDGPLAPALPRRAEHSSAAGRIMGNRSQNPSKTTLQRYKTSILRAFLHDPGTGLGDHRRLDGPELVLTAVCGQLLVPQETQ